VSYLISLSTTVHGLKDKVFLSDECRIDLRFCHTFLLSSWNGISMFYDTNYTRATDMELYTDASSTVGYGGYFKRKWFCSPWPEDLPTSTKNKFSMSFLELYPFVVATVLWGYLWTTKRILFLCDNETTVYIANKGRTKCLYIMRLMRMLMWYACKHNLCFRSEHVPGVTNEISDSLSRLQLDRFKTLAPMADEVPYRCPPISRLMLH
jgi:hypothetical protein